MYPRRMYMANGIPNPMWTSQMAMYVWLRPSEP